MVLIVAGQQNCCPFGGHDLENELQDARLNLICAANLVHRGVHPKNSREGGCFRGLVYPFTVGRMVAVTPVPLGFREPQQRVVHCVFEEIYKNRTAYPNVVAMDDDFCGKEEFIHECSVLTPAVPQQAMFILEAKAAVLERNQWIVQTDMITRRSSEVEIGFVDEEFRSLQRTRNRQNSWVHMARHSSGFATPSHEKTPLLHGNLICRAAAGIPAQQTDLQCCSGNCWTASEFAMQQRRFPDSKWICCAATASCCAAKEFATQQRELPDRKRICSAAAAFARQQTNLLCSSGVCWTAKQFAI